jgi:hypothetical protein
MNDFANWLWNTRGIKLQLMTDQAKIDELHAQWLFGPRCTVLQARALLQAEVAARCGERWLNAEADGQVIFGMRASGGSIELQAGARGLPRFTMTAYTGKPMKPRGWDRPHPLVVDLQGLELPTKVPIDRDHGPYIGHTTSLAKLPSALNAEGVLSAYSDHPDDLKDAGTVAARELVRQAGDGFPLLASIAVGTPMEALELRDGAVDVNGQTFEGPLVVARASTLRGIAIMSAGRPAADKHTSTTISTEAA